MSKTFLQYDEKWGNMSYPAGDTMAESGCGPTSIATVLANSIKPSITPVDTRRYMLKIGAAIRGQGTAWDGITKCLKNFGCTVNVYSSHKDALAEMNKGHRYAILLFKGGTQGGVRWTGGGHFIAATGYKVENGKHKFYMRDSGQRHNDGWFTYEDTMSNLLTRIWVVTSINKLAFDVKATVGDSLTNVGKIEDNGEALVLKKQISKLISSDNYEFIVKNSENEDPNKARANTIALNVKNSLNSINSILTEKSANDPNLKERINKLNKSGALKDSDLKYVAIGDTALNTIGGTVYKNRGSLLTCDNLVQAPTIILNMNGVTIGGYGNQGDKYPNYIESMNVSKVSGKINIYTINLVYQVRANEDPNFIEKLLSRTGFTNTIEIIYGDSTKPYSIFRDTQAIITDVTFNESVTSHQIRYTITALSSIISSASTNKNYTAKTDKPSNLIRDMLYSNDEVSKALLESLPGMKNLTLVESKGLIPNDDTVVLTQTRLNATPISQLMYLVSGMFDSQNNTYQLNIHDDIQNEFGGAYISIDKIKTNDISTLNGGYFELDIGYPDENFVVNFNINMDTYYPLVYQYNGNFTKWNYDIDNLGNITKTQSNPLMADNDFQRPNVVQSNWWKKTTEYPITATVTIRGLIKPIQLMSYIRVNTLFYGAQDLASGLYVVTEQQDSIGASGVFTTLTLLRVGR